MNKEKWYIKASLVKKKDFNKLIIFSLLIALYFIIFLAFVIDRELTQKSIKNSSIFEKQILEIDNKPIDSVEISVKDKIIEVEQPLKYFEYVDFTVYEHELNSQRGFFFMNKEFFDFYSKFSIDQLIDMAYTDFDKTAIVFLYKKFLKNGDLLKASKTLDDAMAMGSHNSFLQKLILIEQKVKTAKSIEESLILENEYLAICETLFMLGMMTEIGGCIGRANSSKFTVNMAEERLIEINRIASNNIHKFEKRRRELGLENFEYKSFPIDIQFVYYAKKSIENNDMKNNWGQKYLNKTYNLYYPTQDDKFYLDASKL